MLSQTSTSTTSFPKYEVVWINNIGHFVQQNKVDKLSELTDDSKSMYENNPFNVTITKLNTVEILGHNYDNKNFSYKFRSCKIKNF